MIVSMWMTRDVITIESGTPITEAAALMASRSIRRLPVVERRPDGMRLKGIVSTGDILHAYPPHVNPFAVLANPRQTSVLAAEIMSAHPVTSMPDAPIEDAAREMCERKIGALPVVHDEILVGLITKSDIFRAFVSLFGHARGGLRITFDESKGEDTFKSIGQIADRHGIRIVSLFPSHYRDRPVWVVRITGAKSNEFLDEIRNSEHRVLNVIRLPG